MLDDDYLFSVDDKKQITKSRTTIHRYCSCGYRALVLAMYAIGCTGGG